MTCFRSDIREDSAYFWIEFGSKFNGNSLELLLSEFLDSAVAFFLAFLVYLFFMIESSFRRNYI